MLIYPPQDPRRKDQRLYKGGDGGAGAMREQEDDRQRKVQSAVDAINAKFGVGDASNAAARNALYQQVHGDASSLATRDLDRQFTMASKNNLFGLARSGLLGGSADAESGADLESRYGEGKINATHAGMQASADLRSADEKTRQNLISMAQTGLDTGTAASLAASQMSAAADTARANTNSASVGRLFDDMGQAYMTNQVLRARYPNGLPQNQGSASTNLFSGSKYSGRVTNQ